MIVTAAVSAAALNLGHPIPLRHFPGFSASGDFRAPISAGAAFLRGWFFVFRFFVALRHRGGRFRLLSDVVL
jgi:hypothetical protein